MQPALSPAKQAEATKKFARLGTAVDSLKKVIENQMAQKPAFQWDLAGAYATYGIADTAWRTGRVGLWTTASVNLLLNANGESTKQNYLTISAYARYMYDNFASEKNFVTCSNSFDVGGRLSFEFDPLSLGFEAIHRNYTVEGELRSQRMIGFLNYRVGKDLYLNGAFGSDFGMDKSRILALFGLNWGFGKREADLQRLTALDNESRRGSWFPAALFFAGGPPGSYFIPSLYDADPLQISRSNALSSRFAGGGIFRKLLIITTLQEPAKLRDRGSAGHKK